MSFNTDIKVKHIRVSKLNRRWAVKNKGKSMYIYTLILFGCLLRQAMIETMRKRVSVRESEKRGLNSILCPPLKVNRVHLSLSLSLSPFHNFRVVCDVITVSYPLSYNVNCLSCLLLLLSGNFLLYLRVSPICPFAKCIWTAMSEQSQLKE